MGHPSTSTQFRHRQEGREFDESLPFHTAQFPEIESARPNAFRTRQLPLPRNTRQITSVPSTPTSNTAQYTVNIAPLAPPPPSRPIATTQSFHEGLHLQRAGFDASHRPWQPQASTSRNPIPTPAFPTQNHQGQSQAVTPFMYPMPRRHSDQTVPSFRLRKARWSDASPLSSPDLPPSSPGLTDEPPETPSPRIDPSTIQHRTRHQSESLGPSVLYQESLAHRRARSSGRISPYPLASTSQPQPTSPSKKRAPRTVKQRIRWIEVSGTAFVPPEQPPSPHAPPEVTDDIDSSQISSPNRKPPPRRVPIGTSTPKPWKDAQIKIDLRLERPTISSAVQAAALGIGPLTTRFPVESRRLAARRRRRQLSVPPISTLEYETRLPKKLSDKKGKGKQRLTRSDLESDIEMGNVENPAENRSVSVGDECVDMLVDQDSTHPRESSSSLGKRQRVDPQATSRSSVSQEREAAGRMDFASKSTRRSPSPFAGHSRPLKVVVVKQEEDTSDPIPPATHPSAHPPPLKQEFVEDARPMTFSQTAYMPSREHMGHSATLQHRPEVFTPQPSLPLTSTPNRAQTPNDPNPEFPSPPLRMPIPSVPLPTMIYHDDIHLGTENRMITSPPVDIDEMMENTIEMEQKLSRLSVDGAKGIVLLDSDPSPRESPMIETPGEPTEVQEIVQHMEDMQRENEELLLKLSMLPDHSSPKPPCSGAKQDTATALISSSKFDEYELEEGEILED
ncbi:hypothetical protein CVT24_004431 [Panaeolus cyanescens]|uniref:Uncharacterized protein n=1 Tax=Panaeolus cyanescens TaxID=181874 RepID=A0A409VEK2_9AGAR|nr:hypothetical protein CVT24_004431 [Panaeolus cyanescens]